MVSVSVAVPLSPSAAFFKRAEESGRTIIETMTQSRFRFRFRFRFLLLQLCSEWRNREHSHSREPDQTSLLSLHTVISACAQLQACPWCSELDHNMLWRITPSQRNESLWACTCNPSTSTWPQACSGCSVRNRYCSSKFILHSVMEFLGIEFAPPTR